MRFSASVRLLLLVVLASLSGTVAASPAARAAEPPSAVIGSEVIGHSVRGRPIWAYHLGQPGKPRVVLIATMHGNEAAPAQILRSLTAGGPIQGLDMWVIPTMNPDGRAADNRHNAHGVDLNRNFPYGWVAQDGNYYSGPQPASEPETRAVMAFLRDFRPSRVASFHQPLYGVDRSAKSPRFSRLLSRALRLPLETVGGNQAVYHGTMTMWFNHAFRGTAVTVEYGYHPSSWVLRNEAPGRLVRALGGRLVTQWAWAE